MERHEHAGAIAPEEAPDALRPPPGNPRFPLVDGLRAFAALSVVVTHTAFLSGFNGKGLAGEITARLDVGVALFFVISGFLLYRPFVAARMTGRAAPRVTRYLRRRALRIVPAYWLALTALAIWPGLVGVHTDHWWVYYGFVQDFRTIWIEGGIKAAWSLCVEVQFYLLLPLYALVCARWLSGRHADVQARAELGALTFVAALSLLARTLSFADRTPDTLSNTIAGTFLWFALGMGLAVASARWAHEPVGARPALLRGVARRPGLAWVAAALLLLATTRIGLPVLSLSYDDVGWYYGHVLYGLVAFAFALPAMIGEPGSGGLPARVLGWRPVAWLGLVSYGIFLWHQPLLDQLLIRDLPGRAPVLPFVVVLVVTAAGAIAIAAASYYLVERPFLALKDRHRPEAAAAAPARSIAG
jgi:peptidoglycan/LPS O-acetylase OafA/YrhL